MSNAQWGIYKNFPKSDFDCKHTGKNEMQHEFMMRLQRMRDEFARPMIITSGYRHPTHPVEARKTHSNGEHTQGMCCDVKCLDSGTRFTLISLALKHGFTRIGVAKTFLHLGLGGKNLPNNVIWDYQ